MRPSFWSSCSLEYLALAFCLYLFPSPCCSAASLRRPPPPCGPPSGPPALWSIWPSPSVYIYSLLSVAALHHGAGLLHHAALLLVLLLPRVSRPPLLSIFIPLSLLQRCIMAPASSTMRPSFWSSGSLEYLALAFCLYLFPSLC